MQMNQDPIRQRLRITCGFFQFLVDVAFGTFGLWLLTRPWDWVYAVDKPGYIYSRSIILGLGIFALLSAIPIIAKQLLVRRTETSFPVWGLRYFRFWLIRSLIEAARWRCSPAARSTTSTCASSA